MEKDDAISRRAAIERLEHLSACDEPFVEIGTDDETFIGKYEAITAMSDLPSAQPEIIRCKECKHHWIHICMDSMPTEICDLDQTFYDANVDFCSLAERRTNDG